MQQLLREHVVTYSGIILGMVPLGRIWDVQAIVQLPVTRGRHEAQQEDKLKCLATFVRAIPLVPIFILELID